METKKSLSTKQWVILALMSAVVLIMSTTPLGTLPLGPLSITLNMIPIAIAAIAVGPLGGVVVGTVFGTFSFLQAMGIGIPSGLGIITFGISPVLTFVQRVVSRALTGLLVGYIFKGTKKLFHTVPAYFITGGCAAILNFIFFMGSLVLLFGSHEAVANSWAGKSVMAYLVATFVSNTISEIIATTLITGSVCLGLHKARLIQNRD